MARPKQRSATSRVTSGARMRSWFAHHVDCIAQSLKRIFKTPVASSMTIAVLAIALSLPGSLYLLTLNILGLSDRWDTGTQLTAYLHTNISELESRSLMERLQEDNRFTQVTLLSREMALEEFKQMSSFQEAIDKLQENPLPPVILIKPSSSLDAGMLEAVRHELHDNPMIDLAQLDLQWVKRLRGIAKLIQRSLVVIFVLLAIAVILIIGNTIRLEIENRRSEIIITRLFGATPAFIRRPFLYDGFWFGLLGGLVACVLVFGALFTLNAPATELLVLYESDFQPEYPGWIFTLLLTAFGGFLGYLGAWSSVSQHLHRIEPES